MHTPEFIFMLTRNDSTVPDAQARLPEVLAAGVKHIGFKDIGLPLDQLKLLARAIHAGGATAYLEVVSLDEDSEMNSARAALALGVDVLMGGTRPESVLPIIRQSGLRSYQFAGRITCHPSVLEGDIYDIVASARQRDALRGVTGLNLLAYRFAGDVPTLIRRVCDAVDKPVYIAGSIDREDRIAAVVTGNAVGFTVGTAALDGVFPADKPGLTAQINAVKCLIGNVIRKL
ncbi:hypothetical protein [Serratia marcescens]|uniref:hypothetical protein n=1 Tax=Serratia marcescens TaxID=615 RepID=UPI002FD9CAB2